MRTTWPDSSASFRRRWVHTHTHTHTHNAHTRNTLISVGEQAGPLPDTTEGVCDGV